MNPESPLIVHVIDSLGVGGAERLLQSTLALLPQYRHVVVYLSPPDNLSGSLAAAEVICLRAASNKALPFAVRRLRRLLRHYRPALVHAHLLRSTWVARLASTGICPLVFSIHNLLSADAFRVNRLSLWAERLTYRPRQVAIGVSQAVLEDYDQWIGLGARTAVLYNTIAPAFFDVAAAAGERPAGTPVRLMAVGNLRRQKNYQHLLQALQHLHGVPVTLDIYGSGALQPQLQSFIDAHGVPATLKGVVHDLPALMGQYDGFILASVFEGFGIAPVEAMAAGLPLILSDLPVFREVTDGHALFFDPADPLAIAAAIRQFCALPAACRAQLRAQGRTRAQAIAAPEVFRDKLQSIYQQIIY